LSWQPPQPTASSFAQARATSSVWLRVSFCEKYDYNGTILYAPVIKDTGFSRHAKLLFVN